MRFLPTVRLFLSTVFRHARVEDEMDEELRSHIENRTADLEREGLSSPEAARRARIEFGGFQKFKEQCREALGASLIETLVQDVRYGLRTLRKSPGFTVVAILTLALGIGASTTVLSVVSGLILRKPPVRDPDGLLTINSKDPANVFAADRSHVSVADYLDWRAQATDFSSIAAANFDSFTVSGGGVTPEFVPGAWVSANFFQVMQIQPVIGRTFLPGEDQAGKDQAVVIGTQLWREEFAADPHVLGGSLEVNGNSHTIVGVMPDAFSQYDSSAQFWMPLVISSGDLAPAQRGVRTLRVFGRLKSSESVAEASAEMTAIAARLAKAHPDTNKGWGANVMTEQRYMVSDWNVESALFILMIAVLLVLLIACANVASMLLARNSSRTQEFSIRAVLGAGRWRLARQLLTESLLLSISGGALGICLAYWSLRAILTQFNWNAIVLATAQVIGIDSRVLIFTAAISILVAIIVGVAPAVRVSRRDPGERLKQAGRGTTTAPQRHRLQRVLVVAQIALSLILLTTAGLFVEGFIHEMRAAVGFNSQNVLTASVNLRGLEYYGAAQRQSSFYQNLLRKMQESPEAEAAALTSSLPFDGSDSMRFVVEGHPVSKPAAQPSSGYFVVSPGYFKALHIPILQGREFTSSDGPRASPVAIVDAAFARRYFPDENPVGRHLLIDSAGRPGEKWSEIVGVVGDVNEILGQERPRPHIFEPFLAHPQGDMSVVIRTHGAPTAFSDSLRHAIWAVDSAQAISKVKTMDRVIADSGQGDNIMSELMGGFAFIALVMAAAGIYGVLSYLVAQRTHEIGIRMALGAERRKVLRLIMRNGGVLIAIGVGVGGLVSVALPQVVGAVMSGLGIHEWGILVAGTTLTVAIVALLASYIPAHRATRVDPMVALRHE
ncbi:MAG TPA: ABC transporter permease [Candidatus Acidoferrales bacterium]|nr:ABC transporter permease [Candidatus Acidoferrales bacterium]